MLSMTISLFNILLTHFTAQYHCAMLLQALCETDEDVSIVSAVDYTDAVHNFILSQKLPLLLGKFPEVNIHIYMCVYI